MLMTLTTYLEVDIDDVLETFRNLWFAISLRETQECCLGKKEPLLGIRLRFFTKISNYSS